MSLDFLHLYVFAIDHSWTYFMMCMLHLKITLEFKSKRTTQEKRVNNLFTDQTRM